VEILSHYATLLKPRIPAGLVFRNVKEMVRL